MANSKIVSMDIYVTPEGGTRVQIPVNPENVQISGEAKFMTYSTISNGEVKIPHGTSPEELSWSGVFYGAARKNLPVISNYTSPKTMVSKFRRWRDKGTECTVLVTGTVINDVYCVSSFKGKYSGGYGDFYYDVKFVKAGQIKIYTTKELSTTKKTSTTRKKSKKKAKATSTKKKTTSYTVKDGDTLWSIAKKKLGDSSRNTEIYSLNKKVIEAAAKKHGRKSSNNGWWIYKGTKLTIPVE